MGTNGKKILIIEDERPMAKILSLKLEQNDFVVDVAYDGEEGLQAVRDKDYDGIILDLVMPKTDGFAFLEEFSRMGKKTPVIVVSNLGQQVDIKRAKELGVETYLVKSDVNLNKIIAIILETLN